MSPYERLADSDERGCFEKCIQTAHSHIASNSLDVSPLRDPQISLIHSVIVTTTFSCET